MISVSKRRLSTILIMLARLLMYININLKFENLKSYLCLEKRQNLLFSKVLGRKTKNELILLQNKIIIHVGN